METQALACKEPVCFKNPPTTFNLRYNLVSPITVLSEGECYYFDYFVPLGACQIYVNASLTFIARNAGSKVYDVPIKPDPCDTSIPGRIKTRFYLSQDLFALLTANNFITISDDTTIINPSRNPLILVTLF